ncbi:Nephrocystin-4 [Kappamyces sp. JEL0680]|nr:Nephrocystin-4 [Kappamyces sp. JEL0680]
MSTERLKLYPGPLPPTYQSHSHQRTSSRQSTTERDEIWPGILYRLEQDGRPAYDRPAGLSVQFHIDGATRKSCANTRYGASSFPVYMEQKQLFIDVWDGDSLLLLGTACVDLKAALRQGRSSVSVDEDVDITWNEYLDDEASHMRRSSSMSSHMSRTVAPIGETAVQSTKLGSLHLRVVNIARSAKSKSSQGLQRVQGSDRVIVPDFHDDIKYRAESVHQLHKMVDVDSELKQILQTSYQERSEMKKAAMDQEPTQPLTEDGKRLQTVYRAMKKEKVEAPITWDVSDYVKVGAESFVYKQTRSEKQKDLETLEIYRERRKKKTIQDALREQITTRHPIDASFGQGYYFEFVLENPYQQDHNFEISWDDTDLRIISSEKEWIYHRKCNNISHTVERNMLSQFQEGRAEVFLSGKEKISIPFLFQNFSSDFNSFPRSSGMNTAFQHDETKKLARIVKVRWPDSAQVSFLNAKKVPVAFLDLVVNPLNFYIDRAMRMFHCENELVRKTIRYPISTAPSQAGVGENGIISFTASPSNEKYLKCSHPDVICSLRTSGDTQSREVSFKYRVGGAPSHNNVYFVFYHDPYCTNVHEIWRVTIHTIHRLDVNCIYGQTNSAGLVIRGRALTRQACCYINLPNQVSLLNPGVFTLPANSLFEIPLNLKLDGPDKGSVLANVVGRRSRSDSGRC